MESLTTMPHRQAVQPARGGCLALAEQQLLDRLSRPGEFVLVRHGSGGLIRAASRAALEDARARLAAIYGDSIRFGEPYVLTLQED